MGLPKIFLFLIVFLISLLAVVESTPPGIANNPSQARCLDSKYKNCTNIVHVCPKLCPSGCTVHCQSCKPICIDASTPPPEESDTPTPTAPPPPEESDSPPPPEEADSPPPLATPPPSPPTTTSTPPSSNPSPPPPPPETNPSPPPPPPSPPATTPPPPSPTPPSSSPPTNTPSSPSPPTSWSPPSTDNSPKTVSCKDKNYPQCYNEKHKCPSSCPGGCVVDCGLCKPVCECDRPGAVCQDPRFIGGDGITFYFHGKRDQDFCLVSDSNLHINAHFIGRRNQDMKRDFTWVQSIAILFDNHQLYLGALKTSTWDDSVDRLSLTFDGEAITLPETEGAKWESENISISRASDTNNLVVEVEENFKIAAKVVPITEEDSRIHNYGITAEDCFAHLDLGFKFYTLSVQVNGVLGQTYNPGYVNRVNIGAKMPVMGGDRRFGTSGLFAADCSVARFRGSKNNYAFANNLELPGLSCASGINGRGVVCKR